MRWSAEVKSVKSKDAAAALKQAFADQHYEADDTAMFNKAIHDLDARLAGFHGLVDVCVSNLEPLVVTKA